MERAAKWQNTKADLTRIFEANKGLATVVRKEVGDHLSGKRFAILALLVLVTCLGSLYVAASTIRTNVGQDELEFVFLRLFTTSGSSMPFSFLSFISFLGPLVGLTLGFDAINGERDRRTLSRVLSQPIFRDALINGKFLAGVIVISIVVFGLGFLVAGLGLIMTGVPPTLGELARLITYLVLSVIYISFWLALAILCSLLFRQTSTSALAGIAIWLFMAFFLTLLAGMAADGIYPVNDNSDSQQIIANAKTEQMISRISPAYLYSEAVTSIMNPAVRSMGPVLLEQAYGAIKGTLTFSQSLLLIWPQVVCLIAEMLICFAIAYISFMRQEIRA
ncbi:MAG TPA: ABC transporter permease [Syntrophomonadaceae bacterium]|nr:ABC transporter permease [Syntrophomonadaceae bacterium]HOQ09256.1 ABC transporter permease [Syntrophomonadaceae bacterium]HPU49351.1 ABC transporter permease [Syntrophomonadaceae bacterium]